MKYKHGGNVYRAAKKYNLKPEDFLDFSSNTNPLGPPPDVAEILQNSLPLITSYPEPDCETLKKTGSDFFGVSPEELTFSNGAVELIYLVFQVLHPRVVLIPGPTFREYEIAAHLWKGRVKHFRLSPRKDFRLDIQALTAAARNVELVFLCNPNNPTGKLVPPEVLVPFLDFCRQHSIFVVVDESYLLFHPNWRELSCIPKIEENKNLLVLHSLTKIFGVPGIRVGCGVAHKDTIKQFRKHQIPWRVNAIAQEVAKAGFRSDDYLFRTQQVVAKEKEFLGRELSGVPGLSPYPSEANFLLVRLEAPLTATYLEDELGKRKVLVRNCNNFGFLGEHFIRIAVRKHQDNLFLLEQVKKILGRGGSR
ncbi:MAG: Threonine-phosphate decarboxylase CobD [Thermoanaerobacterales bacterium 50_218]|nr:MAG: Threonine-phosphate decarboxylase CobD [Thermoanaerobacterales bacterium 50_218]HAA89893.1 threonine-phosphate decarboxylase [Peptococcaceae bacterium]